MKLIKLLAVAVCAFALVSTSGMADDAKKEGKKMSCCAKAKADGKECAHSCCVEAKKAGKVCEKCNPKSPKEEEKSDSK